VRRIYEIWRSGWCEAVLLDQEQGGEFAERKLTGAKRALIRSCAAL